MSTLAIIEMHYTANTYVSEEQLINNIASIKDHVKDYALEKHTGRAFIFIRHPNWNIYKPDELKKIESSLSEKNWDVISIYEMKATSSIYH